MREFFCYHKIPLQHLSELPWLPGGDLQALWADRHSAVRSGSHFSNTAFWNMRLSASWCQFQQFVFEMGYVWAENAQQGEVVGFTQLYLAWLYLGLVSLYMNGIAIESSGLEGPPFWATKLSSSVWAVIGQKLWYLKLVNEWMWLQSLIYKGWLQGQLDEFWALKTQANWEYGTFRDL